MIASMSAEETALPPLTGYLGQSLVPRDPTTLVHIVMLQFSTFSLKRVNLARTKTVWYKMSTPE